MAIVPLNSGASMAASQSVRSMVLVECGSVWTHAHLLGIAEGHCRLQAQVQVPTTPQDMSHGVRTALRQIEQLTGRTILQGEVVLTPENDAGNGLDGFNVLEHLGNPITVVALGPGINAWGPAIRRAQAIEPITLVVLDDPALVEPPPLLTALHSIIICAAGNAASQTPEGQVLLERAGSVALNMMRSSTAALPTLMVIGTPEEQSIIQRHIQRDDFLRIEPFTARQTNPLTTYLPQLYERYRLMDLPGYMQVRTWTTHHPISTSTGLGRITRFLSQRYAMHTLVADVGATRTSITEATAQGQIQQQRETLLGVRGGAGAILRESGAARILRWLPFPLTEDELYLAILMRMTEPYMIAETVEDLAIDHALTREALRLAHERHRHRFTATTRPNAIMGTGGILGSAPRMGQVALMLLDSLQPQGMVNLAIDAGQLFPALGAASILDRMASADTVEIDALQAQIGSCICTIGAPPPGEPAIRLELEFEDGRRQEAAFPPGQISYVPVGIGQRFRLALLPARGVDVGLGPGEGARAGTPIEGGRLGLIVDTRNRPLNLPTDPDERILLLREWAISLNAL